MLETETALAPGQRAKIVSEALRDPCGGGQLRFAEYESSLGTLGVSAREDGGIIVRIERRGDVYQFDPTGQTNHNQSVSDRILAALTPANLIGGTS